MTFKEYKVQKALGTIDYFEAAKRTKSPKVLDDILKTFLEKKDYGYNFIALMITIAYNPRIYLNTLQTMFLNVQSLCGWSTNIVQEACIFNPRVTREILEDWVSKFPTLLQNSSVRTRLYNLQCLDNVSEKDRISLIDEQPYTINPSWPDPIQLPLSSFQQ